VVRVLDARGIQRAHLVGVSLGGMIAQWVAIDAPARVDRLILASTAASGIEAALTGLLGKLALAKAALGPEPTAALAREMVSDHVRDDPEEMARIDDAFRERPREREEVAWLVAAGATHDARSELGRIRCPTLVITGESDGLVPGAAQDGLETGIADARRVVIPGAGHAVLLDQPDAVADAVLAFVAAG
jgi:pimeloyl-ACP methyl ester carboxylesterase